MMQQFNLPSNWREVKLYQYQDLAKQNAEGKGIFEKYIEYLSILTDTEVEEWDDMDIEEVSDLIKNLDWLKKQPSSNFKSKIDKFTIKELNKLTLGEHIDILHFSKDLFNNFHIILAILYRQTKTNEWGEIIVEPYGQIDIFKRADFFLDISIEDVFGIINHLKVFNDNFMNIYSGHFNPHIDEEDLDDEEELTAEDLREIEKEKQRAQWSWESLIYNLCGGDLTKYDEVLDLPLIFVFNQITFKKLFNIE